MGIDLLGKVGIEPQEVNEFASGIDFSLVHVFALRQHGGGVDAGAPWSCEHVGGFQEDAGALFPVQCRPARTRLQCGVNGGLYMFCRAEVGMSYDPLVVVRRRQWATVFSEHLAPANHHGHRDGVLVQHGLVHRQLGFPLRTARAIAQYGFVFGIRNLEVSVGHGMRMWVQR